MLLNDFVKPILKESPGEELSDVLKDPKALKPEILEIITLLQKQVPKWATAPCMEVSSIPNRYFLGYRDSRTGPLDDIVQKFFFIGIDTRGTLDQTDNRHIWIGAKYGTPQFWEEQKNFYLTCFPKDTQINPTTKKIEFISTPDSMPSESILRKWVESGLVKSSEEISGSWYRIAGDGMLIQVTPGTDPLTFKKLMNFSGFTEDGKRTATFLLNHRLENDARTQAEVEEQSSGDKPLKNGDKAQLPDFKDSKGKPIQFTYKITQNDAYWVDADNRPIDKGSREHELLMAVKGKNPDGKTELATDKKSFWNRLFKYGPFKLATYTNKGMRFQNDPNLNALGKLFGVVGEVTGSYLKKFVQNEFNKKLYGNLHDPDGLLFDKTNPNSFVSLLPTWKESQKKGFVDMKNFLDNLADEFVEKYGNGDEQFRPKPKNQYPEKFKWKIYGDNIYRLQNEIKDFVTVNFKEGDVVEYEDSKGNIKRVIIVMMNPTEQTEILVQDLTEYKRRLKPQGPPGFAIDGSGRQTNQLAGFGSQLFPNQQKYREEFKKMHGFELTDYLVLIKYNLSYHTNTSPTPQPAKRQDYMVMQDAYKELSGKSWKTGKIIDQKTGTSIYDKGPGTRHNILNRFGMIVIDASRLFDLNVLKKKVEELDDETDEQPNIPKPVLKVGDTVYFLAGRNTRKSGWMAGVIAGAKRNEELSKGTDVSNGKYLWLKTKDNPVNGFDINIESVLTAKQYEEMLENNLRKDIEDWANSQ